MEQTLSTSSSPLTMEALLAHRGWLRRLAGGLLHADADADDAVQNTLATALTRPPAAAGNVRGWLGTVLTNHVRMRGRSEGRHRKAVATAAQEPQVDRPRSPEDVVAGLDLQRRLAAALLTLDEPSRRVLYLRYFEGLDSPAIAKELELAAGTVRWRLKTALDQLRAHLDAGDGEAPRERKWRALLLPFSGGGLSLSRRKFTSGMAVMGAAAVVTSAGAIFLGIRPPPPGGARGNAGLAAWAGAPQPPQPPAFLVSESAGGAAPAAAPGSADGDRKWERLAPFTGVRWREEVPEVALALPGASGEQWAELRAIDGVPAAEIVAFAKDRFSVEGAQWKKRFSEDLVEVLSLMGHPPGASVNLTLLTTEGQSLVVPAAMTRENRQRVWARNRAERTPALVDRFTRVSPFSGLRFLAGDAIEVEHEGRWQRLVSVNGITTTRLVTYTKERAGDRWRKRIAEDLVEVLTALGVGASDKVDLVLSPLPSGPPRTYAGVPLTEENRRQVKRTWEQRSAPETP